MVSIASGLSNRNIIAATGAATTSAPATRAAAWPYQRRTDAWTNATVPTPISACGSSREKDEKPNRRADRPITHKAAGGLSAVIELAESSDPNSQAVQLCVPDFTAAA